MLGHAQQRPRKYNPAAAIKSKRLGERAEIRFGRLLNLVNENNGLSREHFLVGKSRNGEVKSLDGLGVGKGIRSQGVLRNISVDKLFEVPLTKFLIQKVFPT